MRTILLRLFVNTCVSSWVVCMVFVAMNMALKSTHRIFDNPVVFLIFGSRRWVIWS